MSSRCSDSSGSSHTSRILFFGITDSRCPLLLPVLERELAAVNQQLEADDGSGSGSGGAAVEVEEKDANLLQDR
jgi:hypothetical protein